MGSLGRVRVTATMSLSGGGGIIKQNDLLEFYIVQLHHFYRPEHLGPERYMSGLPEITQLVSSRMRFRT